MSAFTWLQQYAPGFPILSDEERATISDFAVYWSIFENRVLATSASAHRILQATKTWQESGALSGELYAPELAYFRNRYFQQGQETHHYTHLHLRPNDHPDLVRAVLIGEPKSAAEEFAAVLIVIYRYRNNLFHGTKWTYALQGQLQNFQHANAVLQKGLYLAGPIVP